MMEASSSLRPSMVNTAPRPALNKGSSSSATTARVTASRLVPPLSQNGSSPPSSAAARPAAVPLLPVAAHFGARQRAGAAVNR